MFYLGFDKCLRISYQFLLLIFFVRIFPKEFFGLFSIAYSIFMILKILAMYGAPNNDLKSFEHAYPNDKIFWSAVKFKFLISSVILLCLFSISLFCDFSFSNILIILSITLLFTPIDTLESYLNYKNRYSLVFYSRFISIFFCALILTILFIFDFQPLTFCWIFFIEYMLVFICYLILSRKLFSFKNLLNFENFRNYAQTGFSVVLSGFVMTFFIRSDQFILSHFFAVKEIGEYSAIQRITDPFFIFPTLISLSFFAYLTKHKYKKNISDTFDFMFAICIQVFFIIFVFIFFFGDIVTVFLYGDGYRNTKLLLLIIAFIAMHSYLIIYQTKCIVYGHLFRVPIILSFAVLIKFILSFTLLSFGIINVAIANLFTSLIIILSILFFFEKRNFLEFISIMLKNIFNPFLFKRIF